MNLTEDQPLEVALRDTTHPQVNGLCWFGLRDPGQHHSGACRKPPSTGSVIGLCPDHTHLLQAWSEGINMPDPRGAYWRNAPENTGLLPDMYVNGVLIG